ncbi:MAG: thrombospondin type 3 repeat-containing protein [Thiolinea sp.]
MRPATVAGAAVNEQGCEPDDDADGVKNSADQCPATVVGEPSMSKGVPDDDADGVKNSATSARQPS